LFSSPADGAWEFPTSWTPDGGSIVVTTRRLDGSVDIALLPLGGADELAPLVATSAREEAGRISPDGAWLAYTSDASGRPEVYVRRFRDQGPAVQVSTDGGSEPVWSGNSRELFYRTGWDMMVVDVASGAERTLSRPRRLFTGRFERNRFGGGQANFDVSRDARRFLMVRRREIVQPNVIHVVLNWPDALMSGEDVGR
jgi:hypothetical protein